MRKRLFEILEKSDGNDIASRVYDTFMIIVIIISLIPLCFKEDNTLFVIIDKVAMVIFIIDYLLRWITADLRANKKGIVPFLIYPFTLWAIIDLLSILPSLSIISRSFKALRVLRMIRALRILRVFKTFRYSKSIQILSNVIKSSKNSLEAVGLLAVGYIIVSAIVIFNVEPDSFNTFFDAIYWATVSLTTVGYGDIYPVTTFGRIITMISSVFGIAVVALPAGIVTAGYMNEIRKNDNNQTVDTRSDINENM